MAYFPIYVNLEEKRILIVGGGRVALRKVKVLLEYGPEILVVAPKIEKELCQMEENEKKNAEAGEPNANIPEKIAGQRQLRLEQRQFLKEDLKTADLIIAATDSPAENSRIYKLCKQEGKPVNVVDVPAECDFIFPAIVKKKDLVVSVSTGGKSPLFAAKLKKELESRIPDYYGELVETLGLWRERILTEVSDIKRRRRIFEVLVEKGKKQNGKLSEKEIECVIKKEVQ
ncbi:MAG: bifunctional precorrin-2 dehydrogenase/sirohydrochlorin ferrochelatase [Lachnospiraceae bacterium]|nr:bifunctional precorrin-2 dehydrogenase/sirohydrochlorin ferrochelatase [Lachnospiraceae bacterium]